MRHEFKKNERGFSLLEVLVVVMLIMVVMGMAVYGYSSSLQNFNVNSSMASVGSEMRAARQAAISKRRRVKLIIDQTFTTDNRQHVWYQVQPEGTEAPYTIDKSGVLNRSTQFILFGGLPDTPMNFGKTAAVYIGSTSGGPPGGMFFNSSGAFVDSSNSPIDGTLFIGQPGRTNTARAITILGSTGRVRAYNWDGTQWREQ